MRIFTYNNLLKEKLMLKQLRNKKTAKKIWIGLALIIVPAFVFWGLGGALRSKQEGDYAGKIMGKNISLLDFKDAMEAVRNQAIMQFGEDNFDEIRKYVNLEEQAWERLMLLGEAKRRKISANDQEVIELIEKYPFFQRKGQFDNRIYAEILKYTFRTQPRDFEEQTRQNIILSKLYAQVTKNILVSDEELKSEYNKANEEVSIYYIAALPADLESNIKPSEDEIKAYFKEKSFEFKEPLSFEAEYIILDSPDKIKKALPQLKKKQEIKKVALRLGGESKETGLFRQTDAIPGIGWTPEVMNIISKMKPGELSGPIQIDKRYYILKLKNRKEPYIPEYDAIKDKVTKKFTADKSRQMAKEKIGECLLAIRAVNPDTINFSKFAKEFGLKAETAENFKFGGYIEGIGASDDFWNAAQKLKYNEISGIIEIPSGFYILKVKSKKPVDPKKFEAEKAAFQQQILLQKQQKHFLKILEDLKKKTQLY